MQAACAAVVPAAGKGERVAKLQNKLLLPLAGKPVLAHTLAALEACREITAIVIAARKEEREAIAELVRAAGVRKVTDIVAGGSTRQESVYRGILATPGEYSLVAVHDGARPLVSREQISLCISAAARAGAALLAVPVSETLKEADALRKHVVRTVVRSTLWAAQTPQVFRRDWILRAHAAAAEEHYQATDCCELVERLGYPVELVPGSPDNLKITTAHDLETAECILRQRQDRSSREFHTRTGFGIDAHRLVPGRPLILSGVRIPYERGLEGHSDADVMLHALVDALLGAAAAGDIGLLFPSSDPAYRDADSRVFVRGAAERVRALDMEIVAVDVTLVAQQPKIAPFVPRMRAVIADTLQIGEEQVSVKATTTDGLGYTGSGEGMAAYAVATLRERPR